MRKLIFLSLLSCVISGFSGSASADRLDPASCRPLTSKNVMACCSAASWKSLVRTSDQDICLARVDQPFAAPNVNTPAPGAPPDDTNNPPDTGQKGRNNGFGNGDQDAPGNSLTNNNAENDNKGAKHDNPSNSPNSNN